MDELFTVKIKVKHLWSLAKFKVSEQCCLMHGPKAYPWLSIQKIRPNSEPLKLLILIMCVENIQNCTVAILVKVTLSPDADKDLEMVLPTIMMNGYAHLVLITLLKCFIRFDVM